MKPNTIKIPVRNLLFASDLHLNHSNTQTFINTLGKWDYDALIIAGDIGAAQNTANYLQEIHAAINVPILFVMGNHDYYHALARLPAFAEGKPIPSIANIRKKMDTLFTAPPVIHLNGQQIIELSPTAALVGVDGWADGRAGSGKKSKIRLNDSLYIHDLCDAAKHSNRQLFAKMRKLADADTKALKQVLVPALKKYETVHVLTHVPPLPEACHYFGTPSDPDALPFFCNSGMGKELQRLAKLHPKQHIKVLCGHTHDRCHWHQNNLEIWVAPANYGHPTAEKIFNLTRP
jgi:Icc-related predicted phosphoesterase